MATDEGTSTYLLVSMAKSLIEGTHHLSVQLEIIQSNVMYILQANKWHPYKLQMFKNLAQFI